MSRCDGLSYNAWAYLMPGHVLDELIGRKLLRPCSNHRRKLVMTRELCDWLEDTHIITAERPKEGDDARAQHDVPGHDRTAQAQAI